MGAIEMTHATIKQVFTVYVIRLDIIESVLVTLCIDPIIYMRSRYTYSWNPVLDRRRKMHIATARLMSLPVPSAKFRYKSVCVAV